MTWKDKLEIGLKEDAPYRKDNLPDTQVRGPEKPAGPGRSPEMPMARGDQNQTPAPPPRSAGSSPASRDNSRPDC
jgi:hypothetical protein